MSEIKKIINSSLADIQTINRIGKGDITKISNVLLPVAGGYAVSRGLATGVGHYIGTNTIPANSPINFKEDDAFTISFWVKPGWNVSVNTHVWLFNMNPSGATSAWDNNIRIYYYEPFNRIVFRMLNNPGAGNYDIMSEWLFHANYSIYAAGYQAAGLGTTYWNSSNRGYVGDNDFTLITIVKTTSTAGSAVKLYWNATGIAPPITNDSSAASIGMVSNVEREIAIGSQGKMGYNKTGNNTETQYNDFAIWDTDLSAAEVAAVYNSGTPIDLTSDSGNYASSGDLQLYYQFENNGTAHTGADLSGTNYDLTVAGDSNFEAL